jgi:uncharacterized protein YndB with AHSA1/START domain
MSWFDDQAAAVKRSVVSKEWLGKPARAVIASRVYPTNIDDLWDALITPERMRRWFMPVSGDLREGGRYKLEGNAEGTINSCKPPRELAVTWEFNGGIGWVNVTLAVEADQVTSLTLEHIAHEDAAFLGFWEQFGPGAVGVGWDLSLLGLAEHLVDGQKAAPRDEAAFFASGDGRSFAELSSAAWSEASVAFGTDADAAAEAAQRTTAFYTGGGEGQGPEQRG